MEMSNKTVNKNRNEKEVQVILRKYLFRLLKVLTKLNVKRKR